MGKYNSEYQKEWYQKNKIAHTEKVRKNMVIYRKRNKEYIDAAKSIPCTDCGIQYPPYVMQFDHVLPGKSFNLSTSVSRGHSLNKIQAEIDKCEVVCANCHFVRTHNRKMGSSGKHPARTVNA